MSGHSKWAQIKHKKAATDAKKGKLFSQLSRAITLAAKTGGPDPDMNAALRLAIEKARQANVPASNIEKAIKRAVEKDAAALNKVRYEAYGPGGVALLIEGITDNTNRMLNEVKRILQKHGGKLAEPGAVGWMFAKKAVFAVPAESVADKDALLLELIDEGAEEINEDGDVLRVVAASDAAERVRAALKRAYGLDIAASPEWISATTVALSPRDQQSMLQLYEELGEHEDV